LQQAQAATEELRKMASGRSPAYFTREVTLQGTSFINQFFLSTWLTFAQIVITLVLTFFLLAIDQSQLRRGVRALSFMGHRKSLEGAFEDIQSTIPRFLQISTVIYACLGAMTAMAMYLFGMPNPALWGILAMVLGFMPYLGPLIAFACIATVALVSFDTWWQIAAPPLAYGVMSTIEGTVITPMILGRHLTLSPIAIFLSMVLWTMILGIFGALLAVPILVILTIMGQHLATVLRGTEPSTPAPEEIAPKALPPRRA
jgi:predicted PurR-regulated permease PerM